MLIGLTLSLPVFLMPLALGAVEIDVSEISRTDLIFKSPFLIGPLVVICAGLGLNWDVFWNSKHELIHQRARVRSCTAHVFVCLCSGLILISLLLSIVLTAYRFVGIKVV